MKSLLAVGMAALCACAVSTAVHAKGTTSEASMLLTGKIAVSPTGLVQTYAIDKSGKVPSAVMSLLAKAIPRWRFYPVTRDGRPVAARASMALRVVVRHSGGQYLLHVASAGFRDRNATSTETVRVVHPGAIVYPDILAREGVAGIVYVVVRIDRQGHVIHAAAARVNLRVRGPARGMQHWRALFAKSAVAFARGTTYAIPTSGPQAHKDHWVFCFPVDFDLDEPGKREPEYGQWVNSVPGPRTHIPWLEANEREVEESDAIPADSVALAGAGLKRMPPSGP